MSDPPDNNITKLLKAVCGPIQDLENAMQQVLIKRGVDTAIGYQLDVIGKIVGQARNGLDDDTYRRYVRARIRVHNSTGTVEDAIRVSDLIIYDDDAYYHVLMPGTAGFVVRVENVIVDELSEPLITFLRPTAAAGVRAIAETWPLAASAMFALDDAITPGVTGRGLGDALDPTAGGGLASAMD